MRPGLQKLIKSTRTWWFKYQEDRMFPRGSFDALSRMLKTKFMEGFCLTLSRIFRNLPPQTLSGIFLSQKPPFEWNLCCQLGTHRWTLCRNLPGTCQPSQNSPSCQSHGGNEMPEGHVRETLLQGHWISEMFNQPTSILLKKTLRPAKPLRGVSGESHVSWSMT